MHFIVRLVFLLSWDKNEKLIPTTETRYDRGVAMVPTATRPALHHWAISLSHMLQWSNCNRNLGFFADVLIVIIVTCLYLNQPASWYHTAQTNLSKTNYIGENCNCLPRPSLPNFVHEKTILFLGLKFTRTSGSTASQGTGPSFDHTKGNFRGFYAYIETSGVAANQTSRLLSPAIPSGGSSQCFTFWYHMYGLHVNELSVKWVSPFPHQPLRVIRFYLFRFFLCSPSYSIDLLSPRLVGVLGARNHVRSTFSQWVFSRS